MKFYNILIKYRLWIGIVLIALGAYVNYSASFWPAFPLYLVGLILVLGHFFFGPLRLIQEHLESGNVDEAEKVINPSITIIIHFNPIPIRTWKNPAGFIWNYLI